MSRGQSIIERVAMNGGATLSVYRGYFQTHFKEVTYESGYQVGIQELIKPLDFKACLESSIMNCDEAFKEWLLYLTDELEEVNKYYSADGSYVGLWYDNGLLYIDVSKYFTDVHEALEYARENNQIAIFDWSTKTSLNVVTELDRLNMIKRAEVN